MLENCIIKDFLPYPFHTDTPRFRMFNVTAFNEKNKKFSSIACIGGIPEQTILNKLKITNHLHGVHAIVTFPTLEAMGIDEYSPAVCSVTFDFYYFKGNRPIEKLKSYLYNNNFLHSDERIIFLHPTDIKGFYKIPDEDN